MLDTLEDYIDAKLTHSLHTSGAKSFRGCRRRWNWIFREFWYPRTTAKPLEFGVAYHKGMEKLYDAMYWDKNPVVAIGLAQKIFVDTCKKQLKTYEDNFGVDSEVRKDYEERIELGQQMLQYHGTHGRQKDIDDGYKPLGVEVSFEVPLKLWCKCDTCWDRFVAFKKTKHIEWQQALNDTIVRFKASWVGLPVTYGGRIDAILQGPDGRVWIVDWKTARALSTDRSEFLLLDDQITRYCWAMRETNHRVAGFLYHEQKKAVPTEPELLTRRYKGKWFSTNASQDTSLELFIQTVEENDPEGYQSGAYEEYIQKLKDNPPQYSERYKIYRNETELDQVGQVLLEESLDQIDPNLRIYPNPGRFNCQNCAFRQPCLGVNGGEDYHYTLSTMFDKRNYHYWEEKKPSTESKGNE